MVPRAKVVLLSLSIIALSMAPPSTSAVSLLSEARERLGAEGERSALPELSGRIAFSHEGNIWVMHADGSNRQRLTTSGDCSQPAWSADGRHIAYIRTVDGHKYIWVLDGRQRTARRLTPRAGDYECPKWSPDAKWIGYVVWDEEQLAQIPTGTLAKLSVDGMKQVALVSHIMAGGEMAWSPDGRKILFSEGGEEQRLSVADAVKGGRLQSGIYRHRVPSTFAAFEGLHWAEDGTSAVFVETPLDLDAIDSYAVKRLELATGRTRELYAERSAPQVPAMCCDGSARNIWLATRYAGLEGIFHLVGNRLERISDGGNDPAYTGTLE